MKKTVKIRPVVMFITSLFICSLSLTICCNDNNVEKSQINKSGTSSTIELKFLDEYIYPENQYFKGTLIGGLSGIDYHKGTYYMISDDFNDARYYKAEILIKDKKIKEVLFKDVVALNKQQNYFSTHFLDLESIIYHNGNFIISSEGNISGGKNPSIFQVDTQGYFIAEFNLPNRFLAQSRHNGVFESLCKSIDNQGIWAANELPLTADGTEPKHPTTKSPLRFTYYDATTRQATKEFVYELSPLPRPKTKSSDINGLSDILEYKKNQFLVIERAYQGDYVGDENIVKIFKITIEDCSTNVLYINDLQSNNYLPMKKELIFDFSTIKSKLKNKNIDNIEGITFGETLPNGNKTIIFISDDNFQKYGKQFNQFFLFELIEK